MDSSAAPPTDSRWALLPVLALAALVLLSGLVALWRSLGADVSWQLTLNEAVLGGAQPYRDIIEVNPPAAMLLYRPGVLLAQATGLTPEVTTKLLMLLLALAALALADRIAARAGLVTPAARPVLRLLVTALALLVPGGDFAQREHVIALALLPVLCSLAARAGRRAPDAGAAALAGALAGAALAVKPHYGLALLGPALLAWRRAGLWSLPKAPDLWALAITGGLLAGLQLQAYPDFAATILPLVSRVYVPAHLSLPALLIQPVALLGTAVLLAIALLRRGRASRLADTLALAALGAEVAYLVQGKGWPYHALPALMFGLIGLAVLCIGGTGQRRDAGAALDPRRFAALAAAAVLAALIFTGPGGPETARPQLLAALEDLGPRPRLLSLDTDIAIGHPLARRIGAVWAGRLCSAWTRLNVGLIRRLSGDAAAEPLGSDLAAEAAILAEDIRTRRPTAILARDDARFRAWLASMPSLAAALKAYRSLGTFDGVTIFVPKD